MQIDHPNDQDRSEWERLYKGYAEFYEVPMDDRILATVWSWIGDPQHQFYCLLARGDNGGAKGFMHYRAMADPLGGEFVGFLDDLFVEPDARGTGVAAQLFAALASEARQHRWPTVKWITADNNYRARALYDRLSRRTRWVTYEMTVD